MSNIDIDYENHKVSLSLGAQSLHISVLNNVSYDVYSLDVNQLIFNDNRIKFSNLFNLIKAGLNKSDKSISVTLETNVKTMNFKLNVNNDYTTFNHTFELVKQESGSVDLKDIKKSIVLLNNSFGLGALDRIWERVLKSYKYEDIIQYLEKELNEDVIKGFGITNINCTTKNYFEIKSKILIPLLNKYKGNIIPVGNYYRIDHETTATNRVSMNLSCEDSGYSANNGQLFIEKNKAYDLNIGLKTILNYKKINIIYDESKDKWWITFLCLPHIE
jgi:hypothetical protein